jgi:predicted RNA binding protein YcfA (HicA-like mRNA interferase family)
VCRILETQGFTNVREATVMQERLDDATVTVPVPLRATVRRGTLLSIIR